MGFLKGLLPESVPPPQKLPFYQGKLDMFCAPYAVFNAFQLLSDLRPGQARKMLSAYLLDLSAAPERFRAFLALETDYEDVVDDLLTRYSSRLAVEVSRPFARGRRVSVSDLLARCRQWLAPGNGQLILCRFLRCIAPSTPPVNRHWTVCDAITRDALRLFDCSHEPHSLHRLPFRELVTDMQDIAPGRMLCLEPWSLRLLRRRTAPKSRQV